MPADREATRTDLKRKGQADGLGKRSAGNDRHALHLKNESFISFIKKKLYFFNGVSL